MEADSSCNSNWEAAPEGSPPVALYRPTPLALLGERLWALGEHGRAPLGSHLGHIAGVWRGHL